MHGLTDFKHKVVGEVSEEVDSTKSAVVKTYTHNCRAYGSCNVLNLHTAVTLAEGVLNFQVNFFKAVISGEVLNGYGL